MHDAARPTPSEATPKERRGGGRAEPKGRTPSAQARARVAELCAGLSMRRDAVIEPLHRLQGALGGLTRDDLAALAEHLA